MTFVYQKFIEADQFQYDSFNLENPLSTFKYPRSWVVDRERDVILVSFGGQGIGGFEESDTPPSCHALIWRGIVIEFQTRRKTTYGEGFVEDTTGRRRSTVKTYRILELVVPTAISAERLLIIDMIRDAFLAMEYGVVPAVDDVLVLADLTKS